MMKAILFIAVIVCLSLVAALGPGIPQGIVVELQEGENKIFVEDFFYPKYVSDFVSENPSIQSVTLIENGRSYGYVNVFGGVGRNFIIEQGKEYEVFISDQVNVTLD